MKKNIIVYGLISGLIVSILMAVNISMVSNNSNFDNSIIIGYASMLIAFSMIFVGVKNYRDKYNGGVISFGRAFKVSLLMTLVASTVYVVVWLVEEKLFFPDFMDKYIAYETGKLQSGGLSATELADKTKELADAKEMYSKLPVKILMTYAEILPVGLIVSIISSLILKRKTAK